MMTTYVGAVKGGRVELEPSCTLPDGTIVRIEPIENSSDPADGLGDEAVPTGVADLASQHDHHFAQAGLTVLL
jgi:hypothetical protein